jgi:hypothetical protein
VYEEIASIVKENRHGVKRVMMAIRLLGFLGLAIRGHDESATSKNQGNFLEFMKSLRIERFGIGFLCRLEICKERHI